MKEHAQNGRGIKRARALETLLAREEPLCIAIQNVAEFWNAAHPARSRITGWDSKVREEIDRLEGFVDILSESTALASGLGSGL